MKRWEATLGIAARWHLCALLIVCSTWQMMAAAMAADKNVGTIATNAQLTGDAKKIEFTAELSSKVPLNVFTLANPYRVIIDLPELRFQFAAADGRSGKGLVSAYRYGRFAPGKSRVVIDVKVPVLVEKALVEEQGEGKPVRLAITLIKTDETRFKRAMIDQRKTAPAATGQAAVAPPAAEAPKPAQEPRSAAEDTDKRPLIIIDPGHGGVDPGAIGAGGTYEKDVVLRFAKILQRKLDHTDRFRVKLTRDIDTYIPLHDRVKIARAAGAALFLSIHADSLPANKRNKQNVRGASLYVLSEEASDEEAQALAQLENHADVIAGVEIPEGEDVVSSILIDLAQRETNSLSAFYSQLQIKQMKGIVPMHGYFTRSAGFRVLKAPDVPSVLIELGYLSSTVDEANLTSNKWLDKTANVILRAIQNYFQQQVARSPF